MPRVVNGSLPPTSVRTSGLIGSESAAPQVVAANPNKAELAPDQLESAEASAKRMK